MRAKTIFDELEEQIEADQADAPAAQQPAMQIHGNNNIVVVTGCDPAFKDLLNQVGDRIKCQLNAAAPDGVIRKPCVSSCENCWLRRTIRKLAPRVRAWLRAAVTGYKSSFLGLFLLINPGIPQWIPMNPAYREPCVASQNR